MRPNIVFSKALLRSRTLHPLLLVDASLFVAFLLVPNVMMGMNLLHQVAAGQARKAAGLLEHLIQRMQTIDIQSVGLWVGANLVLLCMLLGLRRYVFYPMAGILKNIYSMLGEIAQEGPQPAPTLINMRAIAGDMVRMAQLAQEYYLKHQDAQAALLHARVLLSEINAQQRTILDSASREMMTQYQSVLVYANYLEEQIARRAVDPGLRYDFDEVSESSFNLKLIAGALGIFEHGYTPAIVPIDVPELIQQTMLALAPSLDRRAMKLTTVEVDLAVMALSDPAIIAHVLWMMLLGTIRYAADESTLRLRCLYNREHTRTIISIVVSELSPGRLTEDERGAFLARQLHHLTPHMFAETIRIHANLQLAEMLMQALDGVITILPLTHHSCEICLTIPTMP